VPHGTVAGQFAAPSVHQIAAQCAFVASQGQLIDKCREDACADRLLTGTVLVERQSLFLRHTQKLLHERRHLPCSASMDPQPLTGVEPEPVLLGVAPGQHEDEKIRVAACAQQLLTRLLYWPGWAA